MKNTTPVTPRRRAERAKALQTLYVNGRQYSPSARDVFPMLRQRLLESRPVIGRMGTQPIYGKPTFRNVIDENGQHV